MRTGGRCGSWWGLRDAMLLSALTSATIAFAVAVVTAAMLVGVGDSSHFVYAGPSDTSEPTPTGPKLYGTVPWNVLGESGQPISYPGIVITGQCGRCNFDPAGGGQFGAGSYSLPSGYYIISASASGYATQYWTSSGGTSDPATAEPVRIC